MFYNRQGSDPLWGFDSSIINGSEAYWIGKKLILPRHQKVIDKPATSIVEVTYYERNFYGKKFKPNTLYLYK